MAQLKSYTNQMVNSASNNAYKLMPIGQYRGRIVDVKYGQDKDMSRKTIGVTFSRSEKEIIHPRMISARFDIWHPILKNQEYALTALYFLTQAAEYYDNMNTDDPDFLDKLIKNLLWKEVLFTVDH